MKIYISGKMRGLPEEESRKLFKAAEQYLKTLGHDVINPWDNECVKNQQCNDWGDYILFDLPILKTCDAIYMLNNWEDSWGAKCEYAFACGRGMEIIHETDRKMSIHEQGPGRFKLVNMAKDDLHSLLIMIVGSCLTERRNWNHIKEQVKSILSEHK